jgi:hypothetical protein
MTTAADRNDLMPSQEKLEWVTPKISLMVAEDTFGNQIIGFAKSDMIGTRS